MTTTHDMKTDPRIIYHFIKSQAGSFAKALMELVQNSIDAGATKIEIILDQTEFVIADDGKGFGSEEEIHTNFGTFGTPHEEGDSRFGRFRLGRGQIMAWASTVWHTPNFIMDVDVQNRGLNYILKEGDRTNGVTIYGKLYQPIDGPDKYAQNLGRELDRVKREFIDLVKYADVDIYLNDEKINIDPRTAKWDCETDFAYINYTQSGVLKLYNMGFLVRDYSAYNYTSAVVVTKTHMKLNIARNSVLESECPVWKKIVANLRAHVASDVKKKKLTAANRAYMCRALKFGETSLDDVRKLKLITLATGTTITLESLLYGTKKMSTSPKGDAVGQRVQTTGLARVISKETLEHFGVNTIEEFKTLISSIYAREYGKADYRTEYWNKIEAVPLKVVGHAFMTTNTICADKELSSLEKAVLSVLNDYNYLIQAKVDNILGRHTSKRKIMIGESTNALAWTDGFTYIAMSRALVAKAKAGIAGWTHILHTFVHEYVHDENDGETSYTHSTEFYETLDTVLKHDWDNPKNSIYSVIEPMNLEFLRLIAKSETKKSLALKKAEALAETSAHYENV